MGRIKEYNIRIGNWITAKVGTMVCAYLFTVIALVSLPAAILSGSLLIIIGWIAQTFIQLVMLSILQFSQNQQTIGQNKTQKMIEEHHSHFNKLHEKLDALHKLL